VKKKYVLNFYLRASVYKSFRCKEKNTIKKRLPPPYNITIMVYIKLYSEFTIKLHISQHYNIADPTSTVHWHARAIRPTVFFRDTRFVFVLQYNNIIHIFAIIYYKII